MVARLAAGIDRTLLFVFEELYEFRDGSFFNSEAFLAGMRDDLRTANGGFRIRLLRGLAEHARERG